MIDRVRLTVYAAIFRDEIPVVIAAPTDKNAASFFCEVHLHFVVVGGVGPTEKAVEVKAARVKPGSNEGSVLSLTEVINQSESNDRYETVACLVSERNDL